MPNPRRPRTVVFDVVETLMSLENLRPRFVDVGLEPALLERWFDRTLREGMALTLAGDYQPFPAVAAATLRTLSGGRLDEDAVSHVLDGFGELDAHADAEPAMRILDEAGIAIACLSNGAAETTNSFLRRAGLTGFVGQVLSVADVNAWKPPLRVYEHALSAIAQRPDEVALVAVHAFDCHGAKNAGLTTGWAARMESHYAEIFTPPDVSGQDLTEVARALTELPE